MAHPSVEVDKIVSYVVDSKSPIAVITGGEPAMHNLTELTNTLHTHHIRTHIETSGVYELTGSWDWVVSPLKNLKPRIPALLHKPMN